MPMVIALSKFQFQTGAIKSLAAAFVCVCVRPFQFQTGAIKRNPCGFAYFFNFFLFQFQTGAIKSPTDSKLAATILERFNSKLVRLKAKLAKFSMRSLNSFNSKLVRLKGTPDPNASPRRGCCFNSKLVRLKAPGRILI